MGIHLDWAGVFTGQPAQWLTSGFLTTIWVTVVDYPCDRHDGISAGPASGRR
jgi:hypothetical protein